MPINRLYCQLGYYMLPTTSQGNQVFLHSANFTSRSRHELPQLFSTSKTVAALQKLCNVAPRDLAGANYMYLGEGV